MMKKIRPVMMFLLAAVLMASLTACGSRNSGEPSASSAVPGTSANGTEGGMAESGMAGTSAGERETAGTLDNRTEPDTTHEGVMKGIADDVKNGVKYGVKYRFHFLILRVHETNLINDTLIL